MKNIIKLNSYTDKFDKVLDAYIDSDKISIIFSIPEGIEKGIPAHTKIIFDDLQKSLVVRETPSEIFEMFDMS